MSKFNLVKKNNFDQEPKADDCREIIRNEMQKMHFVVKENKIKNFQFSVKNHRQIENT